MSPRRRPLEQCTEKLAVASLLSLEGLADMSARAENVFEEEEDFHPTLRAVPSVSGL